MLLRLFVQFPFAFGVIFFKHDRPFLKCLNTELCFQHMTEMLRFVFMNMTTVTLLVKSVILGLHSQVFFLPFPALKALIYAKAKNTQTTSNL